MYPADSKPQRLGLWITLAVALVYCLWLGAHWLPLDWSDKEMSASASRVWDIKAELTQHGVLPWWTPQFMSGSSYGLNYARGFYLLPWLLFSTFTSLQAAGKLMALCAIFAGAVVTYFCARHFLRHEWAAVLAALAFMLHPEQIIRAAGAEHMTIILFFPFIPLLWLTFARALESNRLRDALWCALAVALAMWTDNKQIFIQGVFLFCYLLYWIWPTERRRRWQSTARTVALIGAASLALGAFMIVPGLIEQKHVKLFYGDPITTWQRGYSFKSLLGLVDRDGVATHDAIQGIQRQLQANAYKPHSQAEADALRDNFQRIFSLNTDSPEKYAGLVLLAVVAVTALFNRRRVNRWLFWFFMAMLMLTVMLGSGFSTVASANLASVSAIFGLDGVPIETQVATLLLMAAIVMGLVLFARRKLTTPRKWIIACAALAAFLAVPGFRIMALMPFFKEVRAPYVFYDLPAAFIGAMLAGFFVTDVLEAERWRAHVPKIVGCVALLLFLDYWPYQKPMKENGVPERTIQNLKTTYSALKQDADWVKTYAVSGRYFHLLGPMWSGKPQVWEAFYNWMAPLGTGLLNQRGGGSREVLNLFAARYVIFDKTDPDMQSPQMQQVLAAYRNTFSVARENDDFAVFRNDTAHSYITGYRRACLFVGDVVHDLPELSLALANHNWPLVHGSACPDATVKYENVYRGGEPAAAPVHSSEVVQFTDLQLVREDAQRIRIRLNAPGDCLAVIAESYYPFWCAEIDGRPVEVLRVSCALMGVNVPAGNHEIVLYYKPPRAYALAGAISLLALVGCGLAAWRCKS
jgi:hypothetical protein